MADIFHGKCNLQCPVLRLKSNSLSFLICLTEENRKGRGERSRPSFWASSPMEQSPLEVILAMPLHQTKRCPPHSTYQQLLLGSTQESLTLPRLMAKRRAVSLTDSLMLILWSFALRQASPPPPQAPCPL